MLSNPTCTATAWYAAPIPDMKTDSIRLSNAETRPLVFGLHTQNGPHHPTVGACAIDVKFRWSPYKKMDMSSTAPAAGAGPRTSSHAAAAAAAGEAASNLSPSASFAGSGAAAGAAAGAGAGAGQPESTTETGEPPLSPLSSPTHLDGALSASLRPAAGGRTTGMLQVDVVQARDLPARDSNGTSDPYLTVRLNKQKAKTAVRAWWGCTS